MAVANVVGTMEALALAVPGEEVETIEVGTDPNGLAYGDALYVADARSGAILRIDDRGPRRVTKLERAGVVSSCRLGGLARTTDGLIYASRVGFGGAGALFQINRQGMARMVPGLSTEAWRIGLAYDAAHDRLLVTQYLKALDGPCGGSILSIDLGTHEVATWLDGFAKPVGIALVGGCVVVTDAKARSVYVVETAGGEATICRPLATHLGRPDSICAFDRDSVLVTAYDHDARRGSVHQVWLDGRSREIAGGPWEPRGVATDGRRVFVSSRRRGSVLVFRT